MVKKTPTVEVQSTDTAQTRDSGIIVNESPLARKILPLIVVLPANASKAQIERAKVLNGFAYQFPAKWDVRKEALLKELEALKDAPDPVEDGDTKLTIGTTPKIQ